MKKICKSLIVFFTVSWLTAPAYASDPALRYFAYMEKQSGKVEGVSAEVLKRIFLIF